MSNTIANNILLSLGGLDFLRDIKQNNLAVMECGGLQIDFDPIKYNINRVEITLGKNAAYDIAFFEEANGVSVCRSRRLDVYSDDLLHVFNQGVGR